MPFTSSLSDLPLPLVLLCINGVPCKTDSEVMKKNVIAGINIKKTNNYYIDKYIASSFFFLVSKQKISLSTCNFYLYNPCSLRNICKTKDITKKKYERMEQVKVKHYKKKKSSTHKKKKITQLGGKKKVDSNKSLWKVLDQIYREKKNRVLVYH